MLPLLPQCPQACTTPFPLYPGGTDAVDNIWGKKKGASCKTVLCSSGLQLSKVERANEELTQCKALRSSLIAWNISCMYKVNCAWVLLREVIVLECPVHLKPGTKKGTIINLSSANS